MDDQPHSVALFFGLNPEGGGVPKDMALTVAKATKAAVHDAATSVGVIKMVLERGVPATQWAAAATQVIALLHKELSDLSIPSLLVKGWKMYEPFREYCDEAKHPPKEPSIVPLFEHTLSFTLRPVIELRLDRVPAGRVNFEVEFSVTLESVSVVIINKRFMEVRTGAAKAKGTVKCEGEQILEKKLGSFALPGKLSLGEGYPIDPRDVANAREREATA